MSLLSLEKQSFFFLMWRLEFAIIALACAQNPSWFPTYTNRPDSCYPEALAAQRSSILALSSLHLSTSLLVLAWWANKPILTL